MHVLKLIKPSSWCTKTAERGQGRCSGKSRTGAATHPVSLRASAWYNWRMDRVDTEFADDLEKLAAKRRRRMIPKRDELEGAAKGQTPTEKIAAHVPLLVGKEVGRAKRRAAGLGAALAGALGIPSAYAAGRAHGRREKKQR